MADSWDRALSNAGALQSGLLSADDGPAFDPLEAIGGVPSFALAAPADSRTTTVSNPISTLASPFTVSGSGDTLGRLASNLPVMILAGVLAWAAIRK